MKTFSTIVRSFLSPLRNMKNRTAQSAGNGTFTVGLVVELVIFAAWVLLAVTVVGIPMAFMAKGFLSPYGWGFIAFAIFQIMYLVDIPAKDPVSILHLTFFGMRTGQVRKEGLTLVPKWLGVSGILHSVEKRNLDFVVQSVRCKSELEAGQSGGEVTVKGSITYIPDSNRLVNFENSGQDKGVESILKDLFAEDVRQAGSRKTWLEMEFAKDELSANLILKLVENAEEDDQKLEKYHLLTEEEKKDSKFVSNLLKSVLVNGLGDEHDLGIKVSRLNITEVVLEGALKEDAEKEAREIQQRRAETAEAETTRQIAEVLGKIDPSVREDALAVQGKIRKVVVGGGAGDFTKGAALAQDAKESK